MSIDFGHHSIYYNFDIISGACLVEVQSNHKKERMTGGGKFSRVSWSSREETFPFLRFFILNEGGESKKMRFTNSMLFL